MDVAQAQEFLLAVINFYTALVTICSVIAAITPTKKDDTFVAKYMLPIVNALALNFGNAKNQK